MNKKMTRYSNFLCLLVQSRLKITKSTPIFERLKATTKIKTMTCRKPYPPFNAVAQAVHLPQEIVATKQ